MDMTALLLRFGRWTLTQPLVKLIILSVLFQGALVASLYWQQDGLFYAGVVGSWCLIILFFVRQAMVYGQTMLQRDPALPREQREMGYGEILKIWSPFLLHFASFAILSTLVGMGYGYGTQPQQAVLEIDESTDLPLSDNRAVE
ncbi:MAG: hypothetical protein AAFX04_08630 [Pseudomonadota bacterium]